MKNNCAVKSRKKMMLSEYETRARATAIYPKEAKVVYPALGLAGEVGELLEVLLADIWPSEKDCKGLLESSIYICFQNLIKAAKDCEKLKKVIRDKTDTFEVDMYQRLEKKVKKATEGCNENYEKEAGDNVWYINAVLGDLGLSLGKVIAANLKKLEDRKARGVLGGSGNAR